MLQTSVPVHRLFPGLPVPGRGAALREDEPARQDEFLKIANNMALPWLNAARTHFALGPDPDPWAWEDRAARVLILSSKAFDFQAREYPANYVYTGTLRPPQSTDGWNSPWDNADKRPLVVVSTTTTGLAAMWFGVFQASANALVALEMRGLFTVGPLDPNALPHDERLAYRPFVPHSAVLPGASALVSQCGHGATMAALRHGVPMVCVPVFADQHDVAARVVHHGAGIRLSTLSTEPEFRDAIEAVINDTRYRHAAQGLAAKLAAEDGAQRAADEIEAAAEA
jgi:UDP:flavonoid glycosyltransferase YjiC (YdhE family)